MTDRIRAYWQALQEGLGSRRLFAAVGILGAAALAVLFWAGLPGSGHETVSFNADVRPIFNEHCLACHGGVRQKNGYSLLFKESALDTPESGKRAIVPGDPGASELMARITHPDPSERMPPEGKDPLTGEEIATVEAWIEQGAEWERHWAYRPPDEPDPPEVTGAEGLENPIDRFVRARLQEEGLEPSPRADCRAQMRRVHLDLIGLPPSLKRVRSFCENPTDARYGQIVDSLLASPRFGEHWASMWLDLARYADTKGFEKDPYREIWKYRDWVIRAFNRDVPFDRFTVEQLAGDLLPDPSKDQLIATAFHRNTMTNTEGGTSDEEYRIQAVIDRVNTTMEVWQGTTMECVQCHGHPYDPFRHEDFYQLMAYFNNTADSDKPDERPTLPTFPEESDAEESEAERGSTLVTEIERLEARLDSLARTPEIEAERREWLEKARVQLGRSDDRSLYGLMQIPSGSGLDKIIRTDPDDWTPNERMRLVDFYASVTPALESLRTQIEEKEEALTELDPVRTPIMQELPEQHRRVTNVFKRGNWLTPGERVEPDVPASLNEAIGADPDSRLELARWLVDPANPLTARVTVNRFWAEFFGTGIVRTLSDFGTQGTDPTHRKLLDALAHRFVHVHDWSVKSLMREIVTSATYRQSARMRPELETADPNNRLLARGPRFRLSAEQIRDQALAVAGLLSEKMYGPSVMPPQPPGIWNNPYNNQEWTTSEGEDRYRRAVYTFWKRTAPYPSMATFDAPSREVTVSRRIRTNTPLQALVTLNDPVYVEAARGLAQRMVRETDASPRAALARGYAVATLQEPEPEVVDELLVVYREGVRHFEAHPAKADSLLSTGALSRMNFARGGADRAARDGNEFSATVQTASTRPAGATDRSARRSTSSADAARVVDPASPVDRTAEMAALTNAASAILNLDAFIMKP